MREAAQYIQAAVEDHRQLFAASLPMIASENLISPGARRIMLSDLQDRYAEGLPGARYYEGNEFVDKIELKVEELAKKLFGATFADVRLTSGTHANIAALAAFGKRGDRIITADLADGAHISTAKFGAVGLRGYKAERFPFNRTDMEIDVARTKALIREFRPDVLWFGRSVFLFPDPLQELREEIEQLECTVAYDGAHVLGLIAGGQFQDPLREGAEYLLGSTHKTLPGPQHGIIIGNPKDGERADKVRKRVFPGTTSNHHLHAMAALGITLAEHLEFGEEYAKATIRNAQALGQALYENGFKVLCEPRGFTASHTLAVDVRDQGGGAAVSKTLEANHIIANKNLLPEDTSPINPSGIRLGAQELTRLGMGPSEMVEIAAIYQKLLIDGADVKADVAELKGQFSTIQYCFEAGAPAYGPFQMTWPDAGS